MIRSDGDTLQLDETLGRERRRSSAQAEPLGDSLDAIQRAHIEGILEECDWRINGANGAAERLGLHPNTLRFRLKKLGIGSWPAEPQSRVNRRGGSSSEMEMDVCKAGKPVTISDEDIAQFAEREHFNARLVQRAVKGKSEDDD